MWRNTSRSPKIFFLDGICFVPMMLFAVHMSKATFIVLLASVVGLELLRRRGLTYGVLGRLILRKINGPFRPAKNSLRTYKRRARW
jgi:hypothetical protein